VGRSLDKEDLPMMGLLANPFMDSTVATPPETVAQADASQPHLPDASAVFDSSNERRFQEAPVPDALNPHESAGALETDDISEIFRFASRLCKEARGFILDEQAFMAEVEEVPIFVRDGEHLRRWA
jgi:hypothetical protein